MKRALLSCRTVRHRKSALLTLTFTICLASRPERSSFLFCLFTFTMETDLLMVCMEIIGAPHIPIIRWAPKNGYEEMTAWSYCEAKLFVLLIGRRKYEDFIIACMVSLTDNFEKNSDSHPIFISLSRLLSSKSYDCHAWDRLEEPLLKKKQFSFCMPRS